MKLILLLAATFFIIINSECTIAQINQYPKNFTVVANDQSKPHKNKFINGNFNDFVEWKDDRGER